MKGQETPNPSCTRWWMMMTLFLFPSSSDGIAFRRHALWGLVGVGCGMWSRLSVPLWKQQTCLPVCCLKTQGLEQWWYVLCENDSYRDSEQEGQCTYNVTLRCVRESLLPWKSSIIYWSACACVRAALLIKHATSMSHYVTSFVTPSVSTTFFDIMS